MMRFALFFFILSLFSCSSSYAAEPVVLVQHNGQYMGYFKKPRLSDVVVAANKSKDLYWPAASLHLLDPLENAKLEQKKQELLVQLADLKFYFQQEGETEFVSSVIKLSDDLAAFQFAKKLILPLDPDVVRSKTSLNPLLDPGHYLLVVNERPEQLSLYGLVRQQLVPLQNASSVTDYVKKLTLLPGATSSFAYLLPPDAAPLIAKTGLWNSSHQSVSPGAALFVPFEQRILPEQFKDINDQIVELLAHKVVAQ